MHWKSESVVTVVTLVESFVELYLSDLTVTWVFFSPSHIILVHNNCISMFSISLQWFRTKRLKYWHGNVITELNFVFLWLMHNWIYVSTLSTEQPRSMVFSLSVFVLQLHVLSLHLLQVHWFESWRRSHQSEQAQGFHLRCRKGTAWSHLAPTTLDKLQIHSLINKKCIFVELTT